MDLTSVGKWLFAVGILVAGLGLGLWLAGRLGLPLGRLPGDLRFRGEGWSFSLPIVTCILVSIVLTILVNLFLRFWR
jgi:Zn-dependent protease with chaperone function